MSEQRFIPGTQAGVHFQHHGSMVAATLLHSEYYLTGPAIQEAQEEGAHDWEYGERVSFDDDWTEPQKLAYTHGWRSGHTRCDCQIYGGPNYQQYNMNDLPNSFGDA